MVASTAMGPKLIAPTRSIAVMCVASLLIAMLSSMVESQRFCGAKNRKGVPCKRKPMANGRCHFHGGKSPGAPVGNLNALKHGRYAQISTQ
ncbi:HGGxSTG domain-containing protein [Altererythrobacter lutimaris]|uniref:HGGxSTG domain-containing protein n=1 Tax=Altererythrobacter lutimaris TaxID=2743979 RepID=UPI0038BDDFE7